jgi:hypothetical protein
VDAYTSHSGTYSKQMERVKSEIENNILKSPSRQQKLMITIATMNIGKNKTGMIGINLTSDPSQLYKHTSIITPLS